MDGGCRSAHILKHLIHCFELVFGLKVNWTKSHLLGIALTGPECTQMANALGCSEKGRQSESLGLPLGGSPWEKEFRNRCTSRLTRWKANYLYFGGRITLIKATLPICRSIISHHFRFQKGWRRKLNGFRISFWIQFKRTQN